MGLGVVGLAAARRAGRWPAGSAPRARPGRTVCSTTSSMPQSWATTARPPSVTTSSTGHVGAGRADQPAQVAGVGELLPAVDEEQVGVGRLEQGAALGGQDLDLVAEQGEAGQHLGGGLQGAGEQQQRAHAALLRVGGHGRVGSSDVLADGEGYRAWSSVAAGDDVETPYVVTSATGPRPGPRPGSPRTSHRSTDRSPWPTCASAAVALHPGTRLAPCSASARCWSATGPSAPGTRRRSASRPARPWSSSRPSPAAELPGGMPAGATRLGPT